MEIRVNTALGNFAWSQATLAPCKNETPYQQGGEARGQAGCMHVPGSRVIQSAFVRNFCVFTLKTISRNPPNVFLNAEVQRA